MSHLHCISSPKKSYGVNVTIAHGGPFESHAVNLCTQKRRKKDHLALKLRVSHPPLLVLSPSPLGQLRSTLQSHANPSSSSTACRSFVFSGPPALICRSALPPFRRKGGKLMARLVSMSDHCALSNPPCRGFPPQRSLFFSCSPWPPAKWVLWDCRLVPCSC
jgi:hypothetical protein